LNRRKINEGINSILHGRGSPSTPCILYSYWHIQTDCELKDLPWMTNHQNSDSNSMESAIEEALKILWTAAQESNHNPLKLLEILRKLESLHQEIRDTLFQQSLPDNRQALYILLKDIEANGGWPYIYRTKLSELVSRLSPEELGCLLSDEVTPTS
jgi:hypothetical protein